MIETDNLDAATHSRSYDGSNGSIHAWRVASAGNYADLLQLLSAAMRTRFPNSEA
jgi:hypothetical protein